MGHAADSFRRIGLWSPLVRETLRFRIVWLPTQVILPDYLPDNPYSDLNQPAWCSYAMGARSAVMITAGGTVFYQQDWLNTDDLADAIDGYWEQGGTGTWDGGSGTSPLGSSSAKRSRPRASGASEGRNARSGSSPRKKIVTRQP